MLVNNVGIQNASDFTKPIDIESVQREIDKNLTTPVHLYNLFANPLKNQPESAIINISSGIAFTPLAFIPLYCATKATVHSFSLSQRYLLSKTSIKVFEIAPPIVDTDPDGGARNQREQRNMGNKPEEFANLAIQAIENNEFEVTIGFVANLRLKREELFSIPNPML
jgi:uncharacterized oxidoreductase